MRPSLTLSLISLASFTYAQDCPAGYARSVTFGSCDGQNGTMQCGTLVVPTNYNDASAGQITLPLLKVPATTNPVRGTIFYNPGGPGVSAIQSLAGGGDNLQSIVGRDWNIITFDPRGVNLNNPYKCPNPATTGNPTAFVNNPNGFTSTYTYFKDQADTCNNNADFKAAGQLVGTSLVARDIVAVFNALRDSLQEDGLIRYWGFSYGTLLGATLTKMFADRAERVVLDGNINPTDYYDQLGIESVADFDKAVIHFYDQCVAATTSCALYRTGATSASLLQAYTAFLASTQQKSLSDYEVLTGALFNVMYRPSNWEVYASYLDGVQNNAQPIGTGPNYGANAKRFDPGQADATGPQALNAIACGDIRNRFAANAETFKSYYNQTLAVSTFGANDYMGNIYSCSAWEIDSVEKPSGAFSNIMTKNPVLFANGRYDPVTPLVSANTSSNGFIGSGLLISEGAGHCTSAQPSSTLFLAVRNYFQNGLIPAQKTGYIPDVPNPFGPVDVAPTPGGDEQPAEAGKDVRYRRSTEDEAFRAAVAAIAELHSRGNNLPAFAYPEAFKHVQRDVLHGYAKRQNSTIPAGCNLIGSNTTTTTGATTSTGTGSSTTVSLTTTQSGSTSSGSSSLTSTASTSTTNGGNSNDPTLISTTSTYTSTTSYSNSVNPTLVSTTSASTITSSASYSGGFIKTVTVTNCETQTECPPHVPHCEPRTITHTTKTASWVPTITSWTTDVVDVCSTGLTTHHGVHVTHHCPEGCDVKPTGVPDDFVIVKTWCEACHPAAWIDVTKPAKGWEAVETGKPEAPAHGWKPDHQGGDDDDNDDQDVAAGHGHGGPKGGAPDSGSDNDVAAGHGKPQGPVGGDDDTMVAAGHGQWAKPSSAAVASASGSGEGWSKPSPAPAAVSGGADDWNDVADANGVKPYKGGAGVVGMSVGVVLAAVAAALL